MSRRESKTTKKLRLAIPNLILEQRCTCIRATQALQLGEPPPSIQTQILGIRNAQ